MLTSVLGQMLCVAWNRVSLTHDNQDNADIVKYKTCMLSNKQKPSIEQVLCLSFLLYYSDISWQHLPERGPCCQLSAMPGPCTLCPNSSVDMECSHSPALRRSRVYGIVMVFFIERANTLYKNVVYTFDRTHTFGITSFFVFTENG